MAQTDRRGSDAAIQKRASPQQAPGQRHSRDSSRLVQLAAALNQGPAAARVQGHARAHARVAQGTTPVQRASVGGGRVTDSREPGQGGGLAQLSQSRATGVGTVIQRVTDDELSRGKRDLRRVDRVGLGPVDVSGRGLRRRNDSRTRFTGHEYADALAATRRGITLLRADLDERVQGGDGVVVEDPNYARESLEEWTRRSANASAGLRSHYIDGVTRALYDNWRPGSDEPRHRGDEIRTLNHLKRLEGQRGRTGVKVYAQERNRRGPTQVEHEDGLDAALSPFAYRINPVTGRRRDASGEKSRLSLNMDVQDGAYNARRMRETVRHDRRRVNQSKIMGPANIGKRVDDGVVYLTHPGLDSARRVAARLGLRGPNVSVAPPGMHLIAPGVSYAEYARGSSTSHGESRGELVNAAVRAKRRAERQGRNDVSTSALLGLEVTGAGYERMRPHLLADPQSQHAQRDEHRRLRRLLAERRRAMGYDD